MNECVNRILFYVNVLRFGARNKTKAPAKVLRCNCDDIDDDDDDEDAAAASDDDGGYDDDDDNDDVSLSLGKLRMTYNNQPVSILISPVVSAVQPSLPSII